MKSKPIFVKGDSANTTATSENELQEKSKANTPGPRTQEAEGHFFGSEMSKSANLSDKTNSLNKTPKVAFPKRFLWTNKLFNLLLIAEAVLLHKREDYMLKELMI